jgi:hypothetical protein
MKSIPKTSPGLSFQFLLLLLLAVSCVSHYAVAETEMPKSVASLSPASVQLSIQTWDVSGDDEFGKIASAQLHGSFPEFRRCAYAGGPEFDLALNSDPAWEASPEQLATWEEMFLSELDFEGAPKRLVELIKLEITEAAGAPVVAAPLIVDLPNGHIAYVEFDWKCAGNPGGTNTMLQGYALRGSTSLQFNFWVYAGSEQAIAMANDIFAKFQKLDIAALTK